MVTSGESVSGPNNVGDETIEFSITSGFEIPKHSGTAHSILVNFVMGLHEGVQRPRLRHQVVEGLTKVGRGVRIGMGVAVTVPACLIVNRMQHAEDLELRRQQSLTDGQETPFVSH